jgi:hypothetical protein
MTNVANEHLEVAVVARDPGAAAALAPVAGMLKDEGVRSATFGLTAAAASAFARAGCECVVGDPRPAALLLSGTSTRPDLDSVLWSSARSAGAHIVAVIDHWTMLTERFVDVLPDLVCVIDNESRAALLDAAFPPAQVVVVGHPALDQIVATAKRRESGDGRVAFVSEPLSLLPHPPPIDEHAAVEILLSALTAVRAPVVVRAHPREDPDLVEQRLGARVPCGVESVRGDPLPVLTKTSAVVGMGSMLLVETALLGAPVAAIRTRQESMRFPGSAIDGLVDTVPTADECADFLRRALEESGGHPRAAEWADKVGLDGHAATRIVEHALNLCRGKSSAPA